MLSYKVLLSTTSVYTALPAFFRGEEVLQILNPRNPFHVIYMSPLTRIVKRERGDKLQNYLQG